MVGVPQAQDIRSSCTGAEDQRLFLRSPRHARPDVLQEQDIGVLVNQQLELISRLALFDMVLCFTVSNILFLSCFLLLWTKQFQACRNMLF